YAAKHHTTGNGFGFGLVTADDIARTLTARYYKDGAEILVSRGPRKLPRRLTPRECARLMGLPDSFRIPVSDTQAYQTIAKAAVVPMINSAASCIVSKLPMTKELTVDKVPFNEHAFRSSGNWTEDQLKLAFYFYCQTPFGKLHSRNPAIIELAGLIRRSPDALAMKL